MKLNAPTEPRLAWVALILTVGEFTLAIYFLVVHLHFEMIYLAVTYAIRETQGGHHYHEIVAAVITRCRKH